MSKIKPFMDCFMAEAAIRNKQVLQSCKENFQEKTGNLGSYENIYSKSENDFVNTISSGGTAHRSKTKKPKVIDDGEKNKAVNVMNVTVKYEQLLLNYQFILISILRLSMTEIPILEKNKLFNIIKEGNLQT